MTGNQRFEEAPPAGEAPSINPRRAASSIKRLALVLLVLVVVFSLAVRLYAAWRMPDSPDEGVFAYGGWVWICDGGLLYRDMADDKPPLVYLTWGALTKLFGPGMLPTRLAGTLSLLLAGLLLGVLAREMGYRYGAALASLVGTAFLLCPSLDSPWATTEPFMILAVVGMFLVAFRSRKDPLPFGLVAAGVLGGIGFLYKQIALLEVTGLSLWILLWFGRPRARNWRQLGAFWAGFVIPPLVSVAWASHAGILADYRYCAFGPLLTRDVPATLQSRLSVLALSINREWQLLPLYLGALLYLGVRPGPRANHRLLSLWVVAGLVAPFVGGSWGHQFIEAVPPLALATVMVLVWLGHRLRWERLIEQHEAFRGVQLLLLFLAVFSVWAQLAFLHDAVTLKGRGGQEAAEQTLAQLVADRSGPGDTLLPWANAPWEGCLMINVRSGRRNPTRWLAWLAEPLDSVPGATDEAERAVSQAPPRFVISRGVVRSGNQTRGASPQDGPTAFDAWVGHLVSTQYHLVATADRFALYERGDGRTTSQSAF
jgi:hypothetical protein